MQMPVEKFKIKSVSEKVEALYYSPRPKRNNKTSRAMAYIYLTGNEDMKNICNYQKRMS
jgi:hypothetical protein